MTAIAIGFASLFVTALQLQLPADALEIDAREFALPVRIRPDVQDSIVRLRFFVSEDAGKTWTHYKDMEPTDDKLAFKAEKDGLYYFALQIEYTNGKREPTEVNELRPGQKIWVNTERITLRSKKSRQELVKEVGDLRTTVNELKKKIADLEERLKTK